jgi:hypothetical protein
VFYLPHLLRFVVFVVVFVGVGGWDVDKALSLARIAVRLTASYSAQRACVSDVLPELHMLAG